MFQLNNTLNLVTLVILVTLVMSSSITLTPQDLLIHDSYYTAILTAAKWSLPITILMSGFQGSGKSTCANLLQADLTSLHVTNEIFSTDHYFVDPVTQTYQFEPSKLGEYHNKNFNAFEESKVQVRIIDNTNVVRQDYAKYLQEAQQQGHICVMLSTKLDLPSVFAARNLHGVPEATIANKMKKYSVQGPMYLGCFMKRDDLNKILTDLFLPLPTQKAPLHVTCLFIQGKEDLITKHKQSQEYGKRVTVQILGYSENEAGRALLVECPMGGNHITLHTHEGKKPVDVGKAMTASNTMMWYSPRSIECLYMPMF